MLSIPKRDRKYVLLLVLAVAGVAVAEWRAPEPLDWTQSFERGDARPFGAAVPFSVLPALFPGGAVEAATQPPYQVLGDTARAPASYLFLTDTFAPDAAEVGRLLAFVQRGGIVFAAAHAFEGPLADSLRLAAERDPLFAGDTLRLHFSSPALEQPGGYAFARRAAGGYFTAFDTLRATVLGTNDNKEVTFLRTTCGEGAFYLSSTPLAFTNYTMLAGGNADYVYKAFSYLPPGGRVLWDAHYKPLRLAASTPLRYVLRRPALRSAYFLLLFTALLFIVFEGRRRQRAIPVAAPPRNETADFVETVGRLYHQRGDHADLARKKTAAFLDYVRTHLNLRARIPDEALAGKVAERSGVPEAEVRALFQKMRAAQDAASLSEKDLRALSDALEAFYVQSRR